MAVCKCCCPLTKLAPRLSNSGYLLVFHLDQSTPCAAATLGNWLLVCGGVERDEQEQVRAEDGDTGDGGVLFTFALTGVGEPWPVGRGEVGPGREVDKACCELVDDEESKGQVLPPRSTTN